MAKLDTPEYNDFHKQLKSFQALIDKDIIGFDIQEAAYMGCFHALFKQLCTFDTTLPEQLLTNGRAFTAADCIFTLSPNAANQLCHHVASRDYVHLNAHANEEPDRYELWTGIVDRYYAHSWVYDKRLNTIIEPTPLERQQYFGIKIEDPSYMTTFYADR